MNIGPPGTVIIHSSLKVSRYMYVWERKIELNRLIHVSRRVIGHLEQNFHALLEYAFLSSVTLNILYFEWYKWLLNRQERLKMKNFVKKIRIFHFNCSNLYHERKKWFLFLKHVLSMIHALQLFNTQLWTCGD